MGGLLSQPVTVKDSEGGENSCFLYGASAMQGWRPEMEDAHMHKLSLGGREEAGLFGVFDGHGGQEVALFAAKHLLAELEKSESYRQENYKQALHDVFLRLDEMVANKEHWPELKELAESNKEGSPMKMDDSELPEYLNRALIAARQRHREIVGDEDEEEMDDEIGDPNFDPELQDSDDVDSSEVEQSESDAEITTPSYLKRHSFPEPGRGLDGEELSGSEHEVEMEDSLRRGGNDRRIDTRPVEAVVDGTQGFGMASPAVSGWSDGEYDYDYEEFDEDNYSSDDFDSFEDSGDLSLSGKRTTSPFRRPKSKDGKRPRGSRPGSSDSRPRSAPASRPATVDARDDLPCSPFSKSTLGLLSTSRLKPAEISDSGEPVGASNASPHVESSPGKDDIPPAQLQRPKTPSLEVHPPQTQEPPKSQRRQRPKSAATASTPPFSHRRPKTAGVPSTPSESGQKRRPKTAAAANDQELDDDVAGLAACSITEDEEDDKRDPEVALTNTDLTGETTQTSPKEPVADATANIASDGDSTVKDEGDLKEESLVTCADGSCPGAECTTVGTEERAENATMVKEPCSPQYSESDDSDDGPQEHETLDPEAPTAGCTAVVAMVCGRKLLVANAGDSRCVCSREGVAHAMTEDHKPSNPGELKRVLKAGGMVAEGRIMGSLNLSRALGDLEFKTAKGLGPECQMVTPVPEVRELELTEGDEFLVLACDGIWDVLSIQEVVSFVRSALLAGSDPKSVCEQLCDRCCAKDTDRPDRGCDNLSCMVVLFKELWQS